MYAGKKAEEAATPELFHSMRHPYTQALLASMPNLENTSKHKLASIAGMPPDLTKEIVAADSPPVAPYATDRCRSEEPPLTMVGEHAFACFHPIDGPKPLVAVTRSPVEVRATKAPRPSSCVPKGWSRSSRSRAGLSATRSGLSTLSRT